MVLDVIISNSKLKSAGTLNNNEHHSIALVDDRTMLSKNQKELKRTIRAIETEDKKFDLEMYVEVCGDGTNAETVVNKR